jgi:hypothetical protein
VNLTEILLKIGEDTPSSFVCAKRPWNSESEAILVAIDDSCEIPADAKESGYEYFLETDIVYGFRVDFSDKSDLEFVYLILYYAEFDAFPE